MSLQNQIDSALEQATAALKNGIPEDANSIQLIIVARQREPKGTEFYVAANAPEELAAQVLIGWVGMVLSKHMPPIAPGDDDAGTK